MTQRMLPLYEGKMLHHYDHRWATYEGSEARDVTHGEKEDPSFTVLPRYWIREGVVRDRTGPESQGWLMGWRKLTNATNMRTTVNFAFPMGGLGDSGNIILGAKADGHLLGACLASLAMDFVARQKLGGTNFNFFQFEQLPVPAKHILRGGARWSPEQSVGTWITPRVLELTYTAYDMRPFAEDLGDTGEPFVWDPERRFLLRCELDAAFFHLYGIARDDVDYIMETFPIVKGKDLAAHGEFRTKRVILEVFDAIQRAIDTGEPYRTILDPPPGGGPRHPKESAR